MNRLEREATAIVEGKKARAPFWEKFCARAKADLGMTIIHGVVDPWTNRHAGQQFLTLVLMTHAEISEWHPRKTDHAQLVRAFIDHLTKEIESLGGAARPDGFPKESPGDLTNLIVALECYETLKIEALDEAAESRGSLEEDIAARFSDDGVSCIEKFAAGHYVIHFGTEEAETAARANGTVTRIIAALAEALDPDSKVHRLQPESLEIEIRSGDEGGTFDFYR